MKQKNREPWRKSNIHGKNYTRMIALHFRDSTQKVLLTSQSEPHGKRNLFGSLPLPFHRKSRFHSS